jgi:hypothetical protein
LRASLRVHDDAETPSMISLKHASTIAEIRSLFRICENSFGGKLNSTLLAAKKLKRM